MFIQLNDNLQLVSGDIVTSKGIFLCVVVYDKGSPSIFMLRDFNIQDKVFFIELNEMIAI